MRIPVKAQLNGYTPALNPFSKDKLVWFKTKNVGKPFAIVFTSMMIFISICFSWTLSANNKSDNWNEFNVYKVLGHEKFVFLFFAAAMIGLLGFVWNLFVYDFQRIKNIALKESINLYKKAPMISEDKEYMQRLKESREYFKKNGWWAVPFMTSAIVLAFRSLFNDDERAFAGIALSASLLLFAIFVFLIFYWSAIFLSRRYLDKKFNIKSKK